jgi:hypothetical protein
MNTLRSDFTRGLSVDSTTSFASDEPVKWSRRTPINMAPEARLLSSIQSILNKLSETKYGKLSIEFAELGIDVLNDKGDITKHALIHDEETVTMASNAVFDLAVKVGPPELISRLCLFIYGQWQPKNIVMGREPELEDDPQYILVRDEEGEYVKSKGDLFRDVLLDKCEKKFSENRVDKLIKLDQLEMSEEDKDIEVNKFKKMTSNFMAFIANLYNVDLVPPKIMADNIINLLNKTDEIELDSARMMLKISGKKLEDYYTNKLNTVKERDRSKFEKMLIIKEKCEYIATNHDTIRQQTLFSILLNYWRNGWKENEKPVSPTRSEPKRTMKKK